MNTKPFFDYLMMKNARDLEEQAAQFERQQKAQEEEFKAERFINKLRNQRFGFDYEKYVKAFKQSNWHDFNKVMGWKKFVPPPNSKNITKLCKVEVKC